MIAEPSKPERDEELADLRSRLAEAEQALRAIRNGDVDAVMVIGEGGERIYTLSGADHIYRQLIETMGEGAITLSADGVILYANVCFAELLGRPLEQVLGSALRDHLPPVDQEALDAILVQGRTEPRRCEMNLTKANTHLVPVYLSASCLPDEEAAVVFCLVFTDLTEQKNRERVVAAELRYRRLFESAQDGILILDAKTGMIVDVNAFLVELLGYTRNEFLGKRVWELGFLKSIVANQDNLVELQQKEYIRYEDMPLETSDGRRIDVEFVSNIYLVDHTKVIQCNIRDISERKRAADSLHAISAHENAILSTVPDIIMEVDYHKVYTWANRAGFDFFGADVIGREASAFFEGEQDPYKTIEPIFNGNEEVIHLESWQRRKDGVKRLLAWWCHVLKDKHGHVTGALSTARDITEHRRQDAEAQRRAAILEAQINATLDGILIVDEKGTKIVQNQRCVELWKIPKHIVDNHDDKQQVEFVKNRAKDPEKFAEKVVYLYTHPEETSHDEVEFKDGMVLDRYSAPVVGGDGTHFGRIWTFHDVTERKQVEKDLRAREYFFRESQVAASIGSYSADFVAGVWRSSDVLEGIFGIDASYARTVQSWLEIVHPDDRAMMDRYLREEVIAKRKVFDKEYRIIRKSDGQPRWVNGRGKVECDAAGGVISMTGTIQDITDLKKLQAQFTQAQKMESVGRLAGGVAHDFNNLLMGILNYVELCRDEIGPDHPIREWLDEITLDAQRSAEITRQLLAFARKQTVAPKVLDLNDAVAGMLKLLRRLIGEDINLAWLPGANLPPVKLDPTQVDQILANLCINARDAIAGVGKITLETGTATIDADYCAGHVEAIPGAYVFLAVSDDGCGMDPETRAQIFEPFFTTKGIGLGTGLGLATVYGIAQQNNGFIHAYSEPGQGTTFKLYLPRVAVEAAATSATSRPAAPRGHGETVLLVEDEKSLRVTCGIFLEALGYNVLKVETPGEALKTVAGHPGDLHLLLTDVVLPGMDGRQLAQRIRAIKPGVKVLFMSGYTADVIAQRGVLEANVAFLGKPFTRDDLAHKVHEVLDRE